MREQYHSNTTNHLHKYLYLHSITYMQHDQNPTPSPPFSLLCGGTFRIAVYSCDIGGQLDVTVLDIPDMLFNPVGTRGIGEIAITGVAAAIANTIYNSTGKRVRQF